MNDKYFGYPACLLTICFYLFHIISLIDFSKKNVKFNNIIPIEEFSKYAFTFFWSYFGVISYYDPIKICNLIASNLFESVLILAKGPFSERE